MTGATIILLEDDDLARELYKATLECEDYLVICAHNSRNLVQLYKTWQPHLIITDLMMPDYEGMEGIFKIQEITDIPIIAISSNTEYLHLAQDLVSGVLAKPFAMPDLTDLVKKILNLP
jgi:DNA-binding response OmpR family regulator